MILSLISLLLILILWLAAVNFEADLRIHKDEFAHPKEDGDVYVNHVSEDLNLESPDQLFILYHVKLIYCGPLLDLLCWRSERGRELDNFFV